MKTSTQGKECDAHQGWDSYAALYNLDTELHSNVKLQVKPLVTLGSICFGLVMLPVKHAES
jgi:hypothetical protein